MGIVLYNPSFITDEHDSHWDNPTIHIMTMDDFRYWRTNNAHCKNLACFLPINVQLALAYRQYYVQNFTFLKLEQGKTKKAPAYTLVCDPLTDVETFYLFNYYGLKLPQYSSKTVLEFVANIHKARYHLAQTSLKKPAGKLKAMFNIADLYDSRFLQNELELPLDRKQGFNIYFANNRIRAEIEDELNCFQSDIFVASHGESVGRFFHITEAQKPTEIRLNAQTKLNLIEHSFNLTVRGTFVNLPINFKDRFIIPEGGHLGHKQISPVKPKPPSILMNSSILDITSPARPKPVYEIHTKGKKLDVKDTFKSNFSPLKNTSNTKNDPNKKTNVKNAPDISSPEKLNVKENIPPLSKQTGSFDNQETKTVENISIQGPSNIDARSKSPSKTDTSSKNSSETLTLDFTSSNDSKSPILNKSIMKKAESPVQKVKIPSPDEPRTDFITELIKPLPKREKSSDTNSNATTYSDLFRNEYLVFDLTGRNSPDSVKNTNSYEAMHNLTENLMKVQINFKNQLDQLLKDYQKMTLSSNNTIIPDPTQNVSFLNDINQLILAIQNNENRAIDIRQHVLEALTNIINKHFKNPSGPLDPSRISLENVNPNNYIQRSSIAYLDNIRDNIIQIKPPLTTTVSNTPLADKNVVKITKDFYDSIEPLVRCIYEQFNEAKGEIEKTILETNKGLSRALVPTQNQENTKPRPDLRRSTRLEALNKAKENVIISSSGSDEIEPKQMPINKMSSTVQREKKPKGVQSLPSTPKKKTKFVTRTDKISRANKVRFNLNQKTSESTKTLNKTPNKVIPQVSESLYNICDPSQLPDLEELPSEEKKKGPKRKLSPESASTPAKKPKQKGRFMITDSEEEI